MPSFDLSAPFGSLPDPRSGEVEIPLDDALMSAFAMSRSRTHLCWPLTTAAATPTTTFAPSTGSAASPPTPRCGPFSILSIPRACGPRSARSSVACNAASAETFRLSGRPLPGVAGRHDLFFLRQDTLPLVPGEAASQRQHHLFHQLLGATLVHPDLKEVIPLAPEPIIQQDGQAKNDCERNATRRWLKRFRQEHPHLPVIVVEDASAPTPPPRDLREAGATSLASSRATTRFCSTTCGPSTRPARCRSLPGGPATGVVHHFRFCNGVPLNESNPDELVNVLEYWEIHPMERCSIQLDHRLSPDSGKRLGHHAGGTSPLEDENETSTPRKTKDITWSITTDTASRTCRWC